MEWEHEQTLRRAVVDGWYHVLGRGLERREIFADERDRGHFLELLEVHLNPLRIAGLGLDYQGRVAESKGWRAPTAQELTLKGKAWKAFGQQYGDSGCALFLWAARRLCGLTLRELGVAAGAGKGGVASMSVSAVSKTIRRLEQRALRDKPLRTLQSRILEMSDVDSAEKPPASLTALPAAACSLP